MQLFHMMAFFLHIEIIYGEDAVSYLFSQIINFLVSFYRRKVFLEKRHFSLGPIIGHPYGSTWELQGGSLIQVLEKGESQDLAEHIGWLFGDILEIVLGEKYLILGFLV